MSTMLSAKAGGIVTTYEVANFSTSKQRFSFGKGDRFPHLRPKDSTSVQYDLPPTLSKRAPGFGFGDRFNYTTSRKSKATIIII